MGRKPNPIILQYFDRGPKLEDASNRYQHTCKLCGDHFAKGRIDSLINHLTKKCKVISLDERREVLLRLHNVGPAADAQAGTTTTFQTGGNATLPFSPSCQFDRLNVLAEASRQVGATNDPNKSGAYAPQASGEGLVVDPALQNALQEEDFFNNADYYTTKASKPTFARPWNAIGTKSNADLMGLVQVISPIQQQPLYHLVSHALPTSVPSLHLPTRLWPT